MSSFERDTTGEGHGNASKRCYDPSVWRRVEEMREPNVGETYVSVCTKRTKPNRQIGSPCQCVCCNDVGDEQMKNDIQWFLGILMKLNKIWALAYLSGIKNESSTPPGPCLTQIMHNVILSGLWWCHQPLVVLYPWINWVVWGPYWQRCASWVWWWGIGGVKVLMWGKPVLRDMNRWFSK